MWRVCAQGGESVRMGGSDIIGDGLASQPRRYRVPGQPLLNRHQVGGVSRSPDGLFAQQQGEPIRGRPAVRGKRTYSGRPGQRVEEQGTWASRTQKHSEAGYGRLVDRGAWTAKTVKRPRQQPAHPQYANYWAPLTRKRHTPPHPAQPQHTNYWAPQTRKRHQQEHRPQRPTERSDPTQHALWRPTEGRRCRQCLFSAGTRNGTRSRFDSLRRRTQTTLLEVVTIGRFGAMPPGLYQPPPPPPAAGGATCGAGAVALCAQVQTLQMENTAGTRYKQVRPRSRPLVNVGGDHVPRVVSGAPRVVSAAGVSRSAAYCCPSCRVVSCRVVSCRVVS